MNDARTDRPVPDMIGPPEDLGGFIAAIRGAIFVVLMYALMGMMGLLCLIPALFSRDAAIWAIHTYCAITLWMLRVIVGTRVEFRGEVPTRPCIVAAKHQSFLDIIALARVLPRPAFVMKQSLRWAPILGVYAARLGSIPINRKDGRGSMTSIIAGVASKAAGRQVIIYPQGTRVKPGVRMPYRYGVIRLYEQTGLPIVPVAVNAGWFWPRVGIRRTPGTVVVEFLETIEGGQPVGGLLDRLGRQIESASDRLSEEAIADLRARGALPEA